MAANEDTVKAKSAGDATLVAMDLAIDIGSIASTAPQTSEETKTESSARSSEEREENPELMEIEAPVEIKQPSVEEIQRARLDAAWRDMEDKRFEYERMEQEKREKAKQTTKRSVLLTVAGAIAVLSLWQIWQMFAPAPQPKALVTDQATSSATKATHPDARGADDYNEANKLFGSQDFVKAAEFFKKAADQGNTQAQSNLGTMYAQGKGVVQDYQQAMSWYLKAAEQGSGESQAGLATLYAEAKGVPQDYVEADKWLQVSKTPDEKAKLLRSEVEKSMTPEQLATASQKAAEWAKMHPAR